MVAKCKQCGSTDVAWREGKQGGRYLIDTKKPHFCAKAKQNGKEPRRAVEELRRLGVEVSSGTTEVEAKLLLVRIAEQEGKSSNP